VTTIADDVYYVPKSRRVCGGVSGVGLLVGVGVDLPGTKRPASVTVGPPLFQEPMYLDRCVVCCEGDGDDYFELHEITTKDTYILKVSIARASERFSISLRFRT